MGAFQGKSAVFLACGANAAVEAVFRPALAANCQRNAQMCLLSTGGGRFGSRTAATAALVASSLWYSV